MIGLFRLVSWLTRLPPDFELQFRQDLAIFEQTEKAMELLSPIELMAMEKGREEDLLHTPRPEMFCQSQPAPQLEPAARLSAMPVQLQGRSSVEIRGDWQTYGLTHGV